MIICDTREKENDHIKHFFDSHNIPYVEETLDIADYQLDGYPGIVIDRKRNLGEVAKNIASGDKHRFFREIKKAKKNCVRFVLLIEHGGKITSLEDVPNWKNRYGKINGAELAQKLYDLQNQWGIEILFCNKKCTGKRIVEILCSQQMK